MDWALMHSAINYYSQPPNVYVLFTNFRGIAKGDREK